jgi:hypothetical protein
LQQQLALLFCMTMMQQRQQQQQWRMVGSILLDAAHTLDDGSLLIKYTQHIHNHKKNIYIY